MMTLLRKLFRIHPVTVTILLAALGIGLYLTEVPFLELMELKTIDLRFVSRGQIAHESDVVLAVIDEKSIDREGKWRWPRAKIADLVHILSDAGADVIAFDVGFLEPDNKGVMQTIDVIQSRLPDLDADTRAYLEELKKASDDDRLLAEAIENTDAAVVLGYFFQMEEEHAGDFDAALLDRQQKYIRSSRYDLVRYRSGEALNTPIIDAKVANPNIPRISSAAPYAGYFNMFPDRDGVVRWIPAVIGYRDELYAPLSLMTVAARLEQPPALMVADYGIESIRFGKRTVPTDELGRILINYRGDVKTFRHISITDILHGAVDRRDLENKIVLVGATAIGVYDMRVTPFSSVFPGVEIHANIVDSVLNGDFLFQPTWAAVFDILVIALSAACLGVVLPRVGVFPGMATVTALFFGHILFCQYLFVRQGWILNLVYPLSTILAVYISLTAYKYLVESRQKSFIRNAFSTYLAPTVVKQLIESPDSLNLGGEEREITAFFSDVQGFTSISERLTATELVDLLNEFLTEMTDIILRNEGTVDKFEGDAIIAFFGAPNALPNQAATACITCVQMQKRLAEMRRKWAAENRPALMMRIGLCTGSAVVGNMGSRNRMDYTMMGDTVNTAARLEGVNKVYGIYTLVCENTFRKAADQVFGREVDAISVVGKTEPVRVYQVMGLKDEMDGPAGEMIAHYAKGLALYRRRAWDDALRSFEKVLSVDAQDGPSRTMIDRIAAYRVDPPPADWNGAYIMKTK